jgi:hypothetical protein
LEIHYPIDPPKVSILEGGFKIPYHSPAVGLVLTANVQQMTDISCISKFIINVYKKKKKKLKEN